MENTKVIPINNTYPPHSDTIIKENNQKILSNLHTNYKTNPSLIEWCKLYISLSPNSLQNVLDTISDIIIDDQIEVVDIPNMVLLVVSNIQMEAKRYDIVCSDHILEFTKIMINMIIDYELFSVSPILQNNIVVEAMINSCLELIQIDLKSIGNNNNNNINKKEETMGFWKWIFSFFWG